MKTRVCLKYFVNDWRLILLKSTLTIPILSLENVILLESSLKKYYFLVISFVKNQSGTSFNTGRKASTALSHILGLTSTTQYFNIKEFSETTLLLISWVLYHSATESNAKRKVSTTLPHTSWVLRIALQKGKYTHFPSLIAIKDKF